MQLQYLLLARSDVGKVALRQLIHARRGAAQQAKVPDRNVAMREVCNAVMNGIHTQGKVTSGCMEVGRGGRGSRASRSTPLSVAVGLGIGGDKRSHGDMLRWELRVVGGGALWYPLRRVVLTLMWRRVVAWG